MAPTKYDSFRDLKKGRYDWKVTARVMNLWRGFTKTGEPFQSFNLLLLDNKRYRIHAFIPGNIAKDLEPRIVVGNMYLFKNFSVKEYKNVDKFRCLHKDIQIVFSNDTKIIDLDESDVFIEKVVFDFFDLADLKNLWKQTTYLTDVIGVITTPEPTLLQTHTKTGTDQRRIKFDITDGRTKVNVTFWDDFAELFYNTIQEELETPLIVIIGCARITEFQSSVVISNVSSTTFYLNYDHYSVNQMRKMLKEPGFGDFKISSRTFKLFTVEQIKQLGEDMVETEVLCHLKIVVVPEREKWFHYFCTSCYNVTQLVDGQFYCSHCPRFVPYPQKWFELIIVALDETGTLDIILENLPAVKCIGRSVEDLLEDNQENFPSILKTLEEKNYTLKLLIRGDNIQRRDKFYIAKDIMEGCYREEIHDGSEECAPKPVQESYCEPSVSTYHLDSMSENN